MRGTINRLYVYDPIDHGRLYNVSQLVTYPPRNKRLSPLRRILDIFDPADTKPLSGLRIRDIAISFIVITTIG
jgi:hypothetical protein